MKRILTALLATCLGGAVNGAEPVPGRVADLSWMVGYWTGPFGEQTLEEHWMHPVSDTVTGSVRLTRDGVTEMVEFILIEQVGDSLVFRVQQWFPGLRPRHEQPQIMTLKEIGHRRVVFESAGGFDFRTLGYSRPAADRFLIDVETITGERLQIELRPRSADSSARSQPRQ
jgi:hypothetical protein